MFSPLTGNDKKKLLLLSLAACFIAACYAMLRPLKSSVFFQMVGREYYPLTKFFMAVVTVPCLAWYSKLVDTYKKHTILYILFSIYAILCLVMAGLFLHPVFGITNTVSSPYRILGWLFTLVVDFYPTFVVGTFWAFITSISTTHFAQNGYGVIYAFIKIGTLVATSLSCISFFLIKNSPFTIPILIFIGGVLTLCSLFFIAQIIKKIPKENLYGYAGKETDTKPKETMNMLQGLKFMVTKPYVFGIFLIFYCYDVIFNIIEYQTHVQLSIATGNNPDQMNFFLFLSATVAQVIGLILALFLTTKVLTSMQPKRTLLIMPLFTMGLVISLVIFPHLITMMIAMTLLPAIHYSLNSPIREMLFIPTIKQIQFKSKAWMDSFGRSISKSSGAAVNIAISPQTTFFLIFNTSFSLLLASAWTIIGFMIGKKYQETIAKNAMIGDEKRP